MDVKLLTFKGKWGKKIRRFQFTAIDDAIRVRVYAVSIRAPAKGATRIPLIETIGNIPPAEADNATKPCWTRAA